MEPALKALGQRVAATQDESLDGLVDLQRARARLLATSSRRRGPTLSHLALAALVLLLAGFGILLRARAQPLEFQVGAEVRPAAGDGWIAAAEGQSLPITFSDGTQLTLLDRGRARVVNVEATGAAVLVERGKLRASVVPRPRGHWQLFMGPYLVRVTGTKFDVSWEPEAERFALNLLEGSVVVSGPAIDGERVVRAGEVLDLARPAASTAATAATAAPEPAAIAPEPEHSSEPALERRRSAPARARSTPEPSAARALDVRELARAGRYREALAASERAGFDELCQRSSAEDLMLLADVARLAGDARRAERAYEQVRRRFPGRDGGQAAFFLGRLAFDERADYTEAARYFELSLGEQPAGPLAREAAGRLIEAKLLSGDIEGARAAARHYLALHADGPYARTARRLLTTP